MVINVGNPNRCGIIGQIYVEQGYMVSSFILDLMPDVYGKRHSSGSVTMCDGICIASFVCGSGSPFPPCLASDPLGHVPADRR